MNKNNTPPYDGDNTPSRVKKLIDELFCPWIKTELIDPITNRADSEYKPYENERLNVREATKEEEEYFKYQFQLVKQATENMEYENLETENDENQDNTNSMSIWKTVVLLHRLVGWVLIRMTCVAIFMSLCDSASLYMMRKVFELFEYYDASSGGTSELNQKGINSSELLWYATVYMTIRFIFTLLNNFSGNFFYLKKVYLLDIIRNSMQNLILRKVSKLSYIQKLNKFNFGIVDTIINQDIESLCSNMFDLPDFYSHIVYIIINCVAMYDLVGFKATISGIVFLIVSSPLYFYFLKKKESKADEITKLCDQKSGALSQFIQSIRLIKIYTLENRFVKKICEIQEAFKENMKSTGRLTFVIDGLYYVQSFVVSSLCFFIYCYLDGNPLKLSTALTVVELADSLKYPLYAISYDLQSIMKKRIAIKRIGYLLNSPEHSRHEKHTSESVIEMENVSANWSLSNEDETNCIIKDIDIKIRKGEHIGLIGKVGSGKSSLLYTILNETHLLKGIVKTKENLTVSLVTQTPWIRNATVKENILFGSIKFDKDRYERVLFAADFKSDIDEMQNGDEQVIGERGINLSGGQKTRLALARALYHDSDFYIFDDIFSAVDIHTADNIVKRVFVGEGAFLRDKTVILSTHLLKLIPHMDRTIVMDKGRIVIEGNSELLTEKSKETSEETIVLRELFNSTFHPLNTEESQTEKTDEALDIEGDEQDEEEEKQDGNETDTDPSLAEEPSISLIRQFLFSIEKSSRYIAIMITFSLLEPISGIFKDYILSEWSLDEGFVYHSLTFYLLLYISQGFVQMFAITLNNMVADNYMYELADLFQEKLIKKLSRAKLRYYEDIPSGKILDTIGFINDVRDSISYRLIDVMTNSWQAICSTLVVLFSFPLSILMLFVSVPITSYFRGVYTQVSDKIERMQHDINDPTPTISAEILDGLDTVRSYGDEKFSHLIDEINVKRKPLTSLSYCTELAWFWFYIRNDFFRDLISSVSVCGIFYYYFWNYDSNNNIKTIQITITLFYMRTSELFMSTERIMYTLTKARKSFSCVKRVQKFSNSIQEENYGDEKAQMKETLQKEGLSVSFDNVSMRYREDQDLVIRNISFSVAPGTKCCIIGRTASGKTSLFNCLLRFQEIEGDLQQSGIFLSGIDIRDLSLQSLRECISFIPQSPVLFLGTLRENLDFKSINTDEEIWNALKQVGLVELLERKISKESQSSTIEEILDYKISENGSNFSCGEKQLICLARSILKKSKLLLMDEATSNVDTFTDSQIQKTLRGQLFENCTIITIAHRIETVKDYDRIILMKLGEIEMNDTPSQVLQYYMQHYH